MKMITRMETLPNEILLRILSHLSWFDVLTSFWSLNIRFNSLTSSTLSLNDNRLNNAFFTTHGLPYHKCRSILYSLISQSPTLCSSIRNIHFDGSNSTSYDLCYRWLFNDQKILRFPNLKSLAFTRCGSIKSVVHSLLYLVEYQLDELTFVFDRYIFHQLYHMQHRCWMPCDSKSSSFVKLEKERQMQLVQQLLRQIFSEKCRLQYLYLDISSEYERASIHECLSTNSYLSSYSIEQTHSQSYCITLRHLDIRLSSARFLQDLIERAPNLEQLSVEFIFTLIFDLPEEWDIETSRKSNGNWFNKLSKLQCFSLKTFIHKDMEFAHLKWLLNNLNYVEKLQVHVKGYREVARDLGRIWQCPIDANFVRQHCLPDTTPNLIHFNFYIGSASQSSFDDIEERINSFQNHSFFRNHQWTNVKCLFDQIRSCQHLFSDFPNNRFDYSSIFNWKHYDRFNIPAYPSLHLLLEQFDQLSPQISSIRVNKMLRGHFSESDLRMSSEILFEMKQRIDMPFRNVTKIQFGISLDLSNLPTSRSVIERNLIREKVLVQLLSLTVQLKSLQIEQFEWLLHVVQHASDDLRPNALSTVRYVEFLLPSCHVGTNERIRIGNHLLPLLSTHMPHLQTLRLWRPDDFPWTSIRPDFQKGSSSVLMYRWLRSLRTQNSIGIYTTIMTFQHVAVFEQDLCQLFEQLKALTFLDISGEIHYEQMEAYDSMVRTHFPDSRIDVELSRFRLWR